MLSIKIEWILTNLTESRYHSKMLQAKILIVLLLIGFVLSASLEELSSEQNSLSVEDLSGSDEEKSRRGSRFIGLLIKGGIALGKKL